MRRSLHLTAAAIAVVQIPSGASILMPPLSIQGQWHTNRGDMEGPCPQMPAWEEGGGSPAWGGAPAGPSGGNQSPSDNFSFTASVSRLGDQPQTGGWGVTQMQALAPRRRRPTICHYPGLVACVLTPSYTTAGFS